MKKNNNFHLANLEHYLIDADPWRVIIVIMAAHELLDLKRKTSDSSSIMDLDIDSTSRDDSSNAMKNPFLIAVACTSALTAFHFGYAITSINVPSHLFVHACKAVQDPLQLQSFLGLQPCFTVSLSAWGLVGMGLPLGGWIGGSFAPRLVSRFSSLRSAILFLNVPLLFAYAFMALATNLSMLVIGRVLLGMAAGASGMLVPLYLSSVSPLSVRGIFTNFFQLFLCCGSFTAEAVSFSADLGTKMWLWRFSFGAGVLVIALQMALNSFGFFPESPRDLKVELEAEALRLKLGIRKNTSELTDLETCENRETEPAHESAAQLLTFQIPKARKSLSLGILLHAGQQMSGVTAIFFYSSMIVKDAPTAPVFISLINLLVTVLAIWLLERAGRRPIALFSVAGSAVSLLALAASHATFPQIAPFLLVAFVACFAVGLGPIPWMVVPEIFPTTWSLTPTAISICVSTNWIVNIIVSGSFLSLANKFRPDLLFFVFGISCTALLISLSHWLPETRNRPANFIQ